MCGMETPGLAWMAEGGPEQQDSQHQGSARPSA